MTVFRGTILLCLCVLLGAPSYSIANDAPNGRGLSRVDQGEPATIEGTLSYPSDVGLPGDLKVCAVNLENTKETCTAKRIKLKRGRKGYRLQVSAGDYQVYAFTREGGREQRAYFTEFVTCGLEASCPLHKIITVRLAPGDARKDVDPGDWYQEVWPDAVKPSAGMAPAVQLGASAVQGGQAAPPAGLIPSARSYALIGTANQSCEALGPALASLRNSLTVDVADGPAVRAGELKTITWSVEKQQGRTPTYLMITADQPIRTVGEDFYVLTPNAIAPFRIQQGREQTRIVIPLHIKDTARKNQFQIRPLRAGTLHLEASIVGVGSCGELADPAPKSLALNVGAGTPEIVVSNRFELRKPDESILSPAGTRRIDIVGPRWRLIDTASGSQLSEQVGEKPRFSPTGRFIIAAAEEQNFVFDSEDGTKLRNFEVATVGWDDMDSFMVVGTAGYATISISRVLQEGSADIDSERGCRFCSGVVENKIRIDLENNIAIFDSGDKRFEVRGAQILSGKASSYGQKSFPAFVAQYQSVSVTIPQKWDFIDGLKFTNTSCVCTDDFRAALERFQIAPILATGATDVAVPSQDRLIVATRGLERLEIKDPIRRSKQEDRLRDFGLELNDGVALSPVNKGALLRPTGKKDISQFSEDNKIILDEIYSDPDTSVEVGTAQTLKDGTTVVAATQIEISQVSTSDFTITLFKGIGFMTPSRVDEALFLHDSRNPGKIIDVPDFLDSWGGGDSKISGELFFGRYLVLWSKENFDALVYDLDAHKFLVTPIHLPSPDALERLSLSRDLKTLTEIDSDGGFRIIDISRSYKTESQVTMDNHPRAESLPDVVVLLSGRVVDDEVVVWASTGQFDATQEGASFVSLKLPGRQGDYTLQQYRGVLHKAGLLKAALAGETLPAVAIDKFPPAISVKSTPSPQRISAVVDIREEAAGSLRVYQDGQFTDEIAVPDGSTSVALDVARLPGARWIAIVAKGATGLYSQAATFDAGAVEGARRRLHLISVGVDKYNDPGINQLELAASDAKRFYEAIEGKADEKSGGSIEIVSHALLTDAGASKEAILGDLKAAVDSAQPGDTVLLFVAGHGIQTKDNQYYLATTQTRLADIAGTALRWSDLAAVLAKSKSRIAVFLDSCHSGSAGTGFFATSDSTTTALIDNVPSGIVIFSAAKGRELSEESPSAGGGVFTDALVKAMSNKATDLNGNGAIEASELYAGVKAAVMKATDGRQTPWFARNDMVGDFVPF